MATTLDPQALALTKAIRDAEGGNYTAKGASGEYGAYQFMPGTWSSLATKYLGSADAPMDKINQNKAAYSQIKAWKDAGLRADEIASKWNSGKTNWQGNVGVNAQGVKYDTPAYVAKVKQAYQKYKPVDQAISAPVEQPKTIGQKVLGGIEAVGDFLGVGTLGKALGGAAASLTGTTDEINKSAIAGAEADRQKAELLKNPNLRPEQRANIMKQLGQSVNQPVQTAKEAVPELNITPEAIAGSAAQTALLAAPIGVGKTLGGAGLGGKVLRGVASGLLTGGGLAAGRAMEENKGAVDVAKSAAMGGAIGAPLGTAGELVSAGIGKVLGKGPTKLASEVIKETPKKTATRIALDQPLLGEELVQHNHFGSADKLNTIANEGLDKFEGQLQDALKKVPPEVKIRKIDILPYLEKQIQSEELVSPKDADVIWQTLQDIKGDEWTASEANVIKRKLYEKVGPSGYLLDARSTVERNARKKIANAIMTEIENKSAPFVGENTVKGINKELSYHVRLRDATDKILGREATRGGLGLSDYGAIAAGAAIHGAPGAAVAEIAKKLGDTTLAKTGGAILLNRVAKAVAAIAPTEADTVIQQLKKLPVSAIQKLSDTALKNLIKNLLVSPNKADNNPNG